MSKIVVTGGAYSGREGIAAEIVGENIVISGWYDGGCVLDVEINLPLREFLQRLGTDTPGLLPVSQKANK